MADSRRSRPGFGILLAVLAALLTACGGGDAIDQSLLPTIAIVNPTSAASYDTTASGINIGGTIARASFVHVRNQLTGAETEGFVFYNQGSGTWFAEIFGLGLGANLIRVTADADGTGARTAETWITIVRPLQPANLIFNAADKSAATTYWTDQHSLGASHKIAIFADGTGRSTTGVLTNEIAGPVTDFIWTKIAPDAIQILNCPACSFQKISRIAGSLGEASFYGQIETVGGADDFGSSHYFSLASKTL